MKHKTLKLNKFLATLVAACLVLGLLPVLTSQARSANYWDIWTEISSFNIAAGTLSRHRDIIFVAILSSFTIS